MTQANMAKLGCKKPKKQQLCPLSNGILWPKLKRYQPEFTGQQTYVYIYIDLCTYVFRDLHMHICFSIFPIYRFMHSIYADIPRVC